MGNRTARWAIGMMCVAALPLSACGSGSGSSTDAARTAASADPVVAAAKAQVAKYSGEPTAIGVTTPLEVKPTGKRIDYMEAALPVAKLVGDKLDAAAKQLGFTVKRINVGGTPDTIAKGWNEAVQDKPDAVLAIAFGPELYPKQAKALAAAHIPIVGFGFHSCDTIRTPCAPGEVGIAANTFGDPEAAKYGALMADVIISDSDGKANTAYFGVPDFSFNKPLYDAFKAEYDKCAGCKLATQDVQIQDLGTNLPKQVVSYLQSHPDVRYLVPQYGDLLTGVPEAMKAAGITNVKIVTQSSSPASFTDMKSKGAQIADGSTPYGYLAYLSADIAARLISGQEVPAAQAAPPYRITLQSTVDDADSGYWPGVKGYQQQFSALWNRGR